MSMTTEVTGFRPPDEEWKKHKLVWDTCIELDIPIPDKVYEFFGSETPDGNGVVVDISPACRVFSKDASSGVMIDMTKLPNNLRYIRFANSW